MESIMGVLIAIIQWAAFHGYFFLIGGAWLGMNVKNKHQNDMCLEEIGPSAQNMLTIVNFIVNKIGKGGGYMT